MSHSIEDICTTAPDQLKPLTVTVTTARRISGLGNTTIWALIKARKLTIVRVGRRTLVTYGSLEALLKPTSTGLSRGNEPINEP
jgi:hypothetical protein